MKNDFQTASAIRLRLENYLRALPLMIGRTGLKFEPPGRLVKESNTLWNESFVFPEDNRKSKSLSEAKELTLQVGARPQYFTAYVKPKVLADLTEAIIGAFFAHGGVDAAMTAVKALGSWPETLSSEDGYSLEVNASEYKKTILNAKVPIPEKFPVFLSRLASGKIEIHSVESSTTDESRNFLEVASNGTQVNSTTVDSIERLLGYRFLNMEILEEASTHCSVQYKKNNQRLEFLGDAVMDFAVVSLLALHQKNSNEGDLSKQRSEATNNMNLGKKALHLGLQKHLLVMSNRLLCDFRDIQLHYEMEEFVEKDNFFEAGGINTEVVGESCHKALADFLEALIGAVFIDCGGSLEVVQRVVMHINLLPQIKDRC